MLAAQGLHEVASVMKELSDIASSNRRTTQTYKYNSYRQHSTVMYAKVIKSIFFNTLHKSKVLFIKAMNFNQLNFLNMEAREAVSPPKKLDEKIIDIIKTQILLNMTLQV